MAARFLTCWAVCGISAVVFQLSLGSEPAQLAGSGDPVWSPGHLDEEPGFAAADPGEYFEPAPGPAGWLASRLPHFRTRHTGLGQPLEGTSWLNRAQYVGGFLGGSFGATLVTDQVDLEPATMWGMWLGYDLSHYWGSEIRLAFNYAETTSLPGGIPGPNSRSTLADVSLLYYPWGDSRWRPYGAVGIGVGGFRFASPEDPADHHTGIAVPLGFGLKYLWGNRWVLRLDAKDNLVFGGGSASTTHNWSLVGGVEFHWGSQSSAQYYPW